MEEWSIESLSDTAITAVEADSYWCLCRLLESIQDHYTHAQPGIQRMVFAFRELVRSVEPWACLPSPCCIVKVAR